MLSTGIIHKRIQLSKNSETDREKREHGIKGTESKPDVYEREAGVLPAYSAEEVQFKAELLSQRDVLG